MVHKHLPLFKLLVQATGEQRAVLLHTLSETQLKALLEAIYNVLKGTCPVRNQDNAKLHEHRRVICHLVSKELTRQQQIRLLKKYLTLLPLVLTPVIRF